MFKDIVDIIEPQKKGENQRESQGEKTTTHVPEHAVFNKDLWLDKLKELRESINQRYDKEGQVDKIVKMLRKVEEKALNAAPARGEIKKKAGTKGRDSVKEHSWNQKKKDLQRSRDQS
jgi:hypothetical protein